MKPAVPSVALVMLALASPAAAQGVGELWSNNCASCHGANGQGANARSLLDNEYVTDGTERGLFDSIKQGLPDSGMPAYDQTLTDPQMWALVVHIRELQARERRRQTGSPRPDDAGVYTSQHHAFRIETVVEEGLSTPWSIEFLDDGTMLVAERPGTLRIHSTGKPGGVLGEPITGTPAVRNIGQGGLMEVRAHPDHAQNGWIYLAFSDPIGEDRGSRGMTKLVRGRIEDGAWTDEETLFKAKDEHYSSSAIHFGCRIAFDPPGADGKREGLMYFGIGERGSGELAQDLTRPNGKIHRLTDDGKVPADNPFVGRDGVYESIWSYGHRNPQGLVFDLEGNLWDTEHGPRGGDELNLIRRGLNYGWPIISFGINYNGAPYRTPWPSEGQDFQMPVDIWLPSIGACGLDVARGDAFPGWRGDLLAGGLSGLNVDRLRVRGGKVVEREELFHGKRVRDVTCGPDGTVYIVLNGPDQIIRLVPADQN